MNQVISLILPELVLITAACALFLLGASSKIAARKAVPVISLLALLAVFGIQLTRLGDYFAAQSDPTGAIRIAGMGQFVKLLAAGVGALFVLLSWPTDREATGNSALQFGADAAGEFFALMLLSISGIFLVAGANDLILLFLGIELASIPTYIMVSISRPLPAAQEAGVKYFFLGAMSAAIMLFGFSYLYGTTGLIDLTRLREHFFAAGLGMLTSWQMLGVVMVISGFAFKIAAVPLHFYAGDVYEGAATPVTALLSFVPKISGFIALIKILYVISGGTWQAPEQISTLLWVMAALTMTFGNVLGLMQQNVKRMLAYSSVAHTGYMLVGLAALLHAPSSQAQQALQGVLFYLAAYGIMNVAAFGVLIALPSRTSKNAGSAEMIEDLAGVGKRHVGLALAMAVACFSLTGLPLTIGFWGKVYLILPAWRAGNTWLVVLMMINAAISAGYYLRIVAVMFLRPEPQASSPETIPARGMPILLAIGISTAATVLFGTVIPATEMLRSQAIQASTIDAPIATAPSASARP